MSEHGSQGVRRPDVAPDRYSGEAVRVLWRINGVVVFRRADGRVDQLPSWRIRLTSGEARSGHLATFNKAMEAGDVATAAAYEETLR